MTEYTTDPKDPRLTRGTDSEETSQNPVYLVLSEEERSKGYVRPLRSSYKHKTCGSVTTMGLTLAQTYARDPSFYGATYCVACQKHLLVSEFVWEPRGETVGS